MSRKVSGQIPEWPNGADCKSAVFRLRWFESIFAHKEMRIILHLFVFYIPTQHTLPIDHKASLRLERLENLERLEKEERHKEKTTEKSMTVEKTEKAETAEKHPVNKKIRDDLSHLLFSCSGTRD